jgi:hypothetical protein
MKKKTQWGKENDQKKEKEKKAGAKKSQGPNQGTNNYQQAPKLHLYFYFLLLYYGTLQKEY